MVGYTILFNVSHVTIIWTVQNVIDSKILSVSRFNGESYE